MTTRDSSRVTLQTEEYDALKRIVAEVRHCGASHPSPCPSILEALAEYDNLFIRRA